MRPHHGLRAYDAVHLASVLAAADPELRFACWNRELGAAAAAEGVSLVPSA